MKTTLKHLPEIKLYELSIVKRTILEFCPDIEMIILFGSFARGDWVEDKYQEDQISYEYKSDFDLLLIFNSEGQANSVSLKHKLETLIRDANVKTRISLILHTIQFVNNRITRGNFFFTNIKKEGIMLYNAKNHKLSKHKKLNNVERQKNAQEDFEHWFISATGFLETFRFYLKRGKFTQAVFLLHQATERYYHAIILGFIGYKPKTHDLEELGRYAKNLSPEFDKVFPKSTKEEKRLFELLQKAYVDARYKKDYTIEKNELEYLEQKVKLLKEMTKRICTEKIKGFVGKSKKLKAIYNQYFAK
ncbi:MAG: HEPN domain-containing protein, partial [Bacteroidales bacterium]|nr:HEPN domain-containing protein [Bacteroidales bacterium]